MRDESDDIDYTPSSLVLPSRSTVSLTDARGTSVAMSTLDQSTEESINLFQNQESRLMVKPLTVKNRSFELGSFGSILKAESKSPLPTNKKLSSIKKPLLEEN